ncbi:MAG TPA: hypothetical protein VK306_14210 [Acidimicrobiales bacterium]|nr:hypothetical protein [Acidimicrobiales bacterium]
MARPPGATRAGEHAGNLAHPGVSVEHDITGAEVQALEPALPLFVHQAGYPVEVIRMRAHLTARIDVAEQRARPFDCSAPPASTMTPPPLEVLALGGYR